MPLVTDKKYLSHFFFRILYSINCDKYLFKCQKLYFLMHTSCKWILPTLAESKNVETKMPKKVE